MRSAFDRRYGACPRDCVTACERESRATGDPHTPYNAILVMSDAEWFEQLVEHLASKRQLEPQMLANGPTEFHAQLGTRHGKPLYEIKIDLSKDRASYCDADVPYGEVLKVFQGVDGRTVFPL